LDVTARDGRGSGNTGTKSEKRGPSRVIEPDKQYHFGPAAVGRVQVGLWKPKVPEPVASRPKPFSYRIGGRIPFVTTVQSSVVAIKCLLTGVGLPVFWH
jgi:hypothetical protein